MHFGLANVELINYFILSKFRRPPSPPGRDQQEYIIMNAIGMSLVALAIVFSYILHRETLRCRTHTLVRAGDSM